MSGVSASFQTESICVRGNTLLIRQFLQNCGVTRSTCGCVEAYLRFESDHTLGVVTSRECNVAFDPSGRSLA